MVDAVLRGLDVSSVLTSGTMGHYICMHGAYVLLADSCVMCLDVRNISEVRNISSGAIDARASAHNTHTHTDTHTHTHTHTHNTHHAQIYNGLPFCQSLSLSLSHFIMHKHTRTNEGVGAGRVSDLDLRVGFRV